MLNVMYCVLALVFAAVVFGLGIFKTAVSHVPGCACSECHAKQR